MKTSKTNSLIVHRAEKQTHATKNRNARKDRWVTWSRDVSLNFSTCQYCCCRRALLTRVLKWMSKVVVLPLRHQRHQTATLPGIYTRSCRQCIASQFFCYHQVRLSCSVLLWRVVQNDESKRNNVKSLWFLVKEKVDVFEKPPPMWELLDIVCTMYTCVQYRVTLSLLSCSKRIWVTESSSRCCELKKKRRCSREGGSQRTEV